MALRALETVSFSKAKDASSHFRKCAPSILRIALNHLDHYHTLNATTGFFAHSSMSIKDVDSSFDITALCRALLDSFRISTPTYWLFDHAMICFEAKIYDMARKYKHISSFTTLHTAFLHSEDFMRRIRSLSSLLEMDLRKDPPEEQQRTQKPDCCLTATSLLVDTRIEDLPPKLLQLMDKYGRESTHMSSILRARTEYASLAEESTSSNADLCKIGRSLAQLIQDYQYALPDVYCLHCGQVRNCRECFPKLEWPKLVERCIEELRRQSPLSDGDTLATDILQWKLCSYTEDITEWEKRVKDMTAKHPERAIFRYRDAHRQGFPMKLLHTETTSALECPNVPRWLEHGLRAMLVEAGFELALTLGRTGDKECYPLMLCSRTNAKILLDEGSPDDPRRAYYAAVYILSHLVLEGSGANFKKPTIKVSSIFSRSLFRANVGRARSYSVLSRR